MNVSKATDIFGREVGVKTQRGKIDKRTRRKKSVVIVLNREDSWKRYHAARVQKVLMYSTIFVRGLVWEIRGSTGKDVYVGKFVVTYFIMNHARHTWT